MGNMKEIGLLDCEDRQSIEENFKRILKNDAEGGGADVLNENGKLKNEVLPEGYPYDAGSFYYDNSGFVRGESELVGGAYFKASDDVIAYEDIRGAAIIYNDRNMLIDDMLQEEGLVDYAEGEYCRISEFVIIAYKDNVSVATLEGGDILITSKGIYISAVAPVSFSKTAIVPMAEKFLPPGIGGGGSNFVVHFIGSEGEYTLDATVDEIIDAILDGKNVVVVDDNIEGTQPRVYHLTRYALDTADSGKEAHFIYVEMMNGYIYLATIYITETETGFYEGRATYNTD